VRFWISIRIEERGLTDRRHSHKIYSPLVDVTTLKSRIIIVGLEDCYLPGRILFAGNECETRAQINIGRWRKKCQMKLHPK
jgi:hypothetical protein